MLSEDNEKTRRGSEEEKACLICGGVKTDCSIMMTLWCICPFWFVIFSQNMKRSLSSGLCTRQTLHQQTSFSSPCWNPYWKDDNLSLSRRLWKICCQSYAVFQKYYSRNASKSGRITESDVEKVEDSTWKGTKPNSSKVGEKIILNCSEFLWTDFVYIYIDSDKWILIWSITGIISDSGNH